MQASNEWARRPADQRFSTLDDLLLNQLKHHTDSKQVNVGIKTLRVDATGGKLTLQTPQGPLGYTNWSFGQFAQRVGAPASYLRTLSPRLVAENLNESIDSTEAETMQLYFENEGRRRALALTSQKYSRIANWEVVKGVKALPGNWRTAPAIPTQGGPNTRIATAADVGPWTRVNIGDPIMDAGLYGSDEDIFIFQICPDAAVELDSGPLFRGFFVRNSEVGKATFEITRFLFQQICGNHIVWGASEFESISIRHLGRNARTRAFDQLGTELKKYAEMSVKEEKSALERATVIELGKTREELVDNLYQRKDLQLTKRVINAAYDVAVENETAQRSSPRSAWGFVQGLTRVSQDSPFADERTKLDRAAGRILSFATQTKPVDSIPVDLAVA